MVVQFIANPEQQRIHTGVRDGASVKTDPRCNITLARKEGEAGTRYIEPDVALDLVNNEDWEWCQTCSAKPEKLAN